MAEKHVKTIRLYNRMSHAFHASVVIPALSFMDVPEEEGKKLLEGYPNRLALASEAQKELNGPAVRLAEVNAEKAALEKRVAELEAQLKKQAPSGV